jgi:hypothetical protein
MSDPRFAKLKTDPRFRRIRNKESKVVVDERFKSVFGKEEGEKKKKKGKGKGPVYCRLLQLSAAELTDTQDASTSMAGHSLTHMNRIICVAFTV